MAMYQLIKHWDRLGQTVDLSFLVFDHDHPIVWVPLVGLIPIYRHILGGRFLLRTPNYADATETLTH